jgi:hypothetical protein
VTEDETKEELIEGIKWTRDMLCQEMKKAMSMSRVDDDAPGSIWVHSFLEPDGPSATVEFDVTAEANMVWHRRIKDCLDMLRATGLKVEHFCQFNSSRAVFHHRIVVRYEYRGCLQE